MKILVNVFVLLSLFACGQGIMAQVSGTVFRDFNANGVKDNIAPYSEPFVSGVTVLAFNASGSLAGLATTDANGYYSFTGLTLPLRIEFGDGLVGDNTSLSGAGNFTSVQFYDAPSTTANYGLYYPDEYVGSTNPRMSAIQQTGGDPLAGGTAGTAGIIKTVDYNSVNSSLNNLQVDALSAQVGSLWGLAWYPAKEKLFSAAFVKRHVGLGPLGIGGLYVTDMSGAVNATSNFIDLDAVPGIDLGTIGTNSARGLPANFNVGSVDATVLPLVGKAGLGDIDVSISQKKLFVTNLFERNIIVIDIANYLATGALPTAANVTELPIGNMPTCTNGVARPFALKVYRDQLYVGVTCTGELDLPSASAANMSASVLAYNLIDNSWTTPISSSSLNYTHGFPQIVSDLVNHPWSDDMSSNAATINGVDGWTLKPKVVNGVSYYQSSRVSPWLTDIEFDIDGSMILGLRDRTGDQWGGFQPHPTVPSTIMDIRIGGDILRYNYDGSTYTRESAGTTLEGGGCGAAADEYYCGEAYMVDLSHRETSQGSLALLPGLNEVVLSSINPTTTIWSGGLIKLNNTTGQKNSGILYYQTTEWNVNTLQFGIGLGGKSNGMGDVELLQSAPPIEIGNRIWIDTDVDGIQDPGETVLSNVTVELYAADGTTLISSTTTSSTGQWFFNSTNVTGGLQPNTDYIIKIGSSDWSGGAGLAELSGLTLTNANSDGTTNGDIRDSDAILLNGVPSITYTTGEFGINDHTLDMGFRALPPCSIAIDVTSTPPTAACDPNNLGKYILTVHLIYSNLPGTDILINGQQVTTDGSGDQVFNIPGFDANGAVTTITATAVGDNTCTATELNAFTAPTLESCTDVPNPCESPACPVVPTYQVCADGSNNEVLTTSSTFNDIVWYNSSGAVVPSVNGVLTVDANTPGMEDGSECFYAESSDPNYCPATSCCPVIIQTEECCPTPNCYELIVVPNN